MNGTSLHIMEEPALTRRRLRLVCVGAGYSGLTLAHKVQHEKKLEDVIDLQIYEKNDEVGGTWFENTYPGAACDIPARKLHSIMTQQGFFADINWRCLHLPV